ncbi:MAG TPA: cytochrome c [Pyrinomonadaceae bacterium]|nr:cytochrome c [Pyrinomonadaceae bacterium]
MRKSILPLLAFLLLVAAVVFVTSFEIAVTSSAQNANSSTTTNKNQNQNDSRSISSGSGARQQDFSKNTWELPEDADKTKNPTAATPESIAKGKELYLEPQKGNCIFCHGETGAGNEATISSGRLRRKPADLTNQERMTAMTDGEVFWKVTKGIQGIMPAGEKRLSEEERWHVVNYVRTLAKDKQ